MYSGTTIRIKSGRVMGVHQKIDRVAHRHISKHLTKKQHFPSLHDILHFEGTNGPDGIKRKSPARDVPWHFIDPDNPHDRVIVDMINDHIHNMATALHTGNETRAAFEAAWLSHAIVDGLTPAHHYPLDEKIEELWGRPKEERLTVRDKNIIRGKNRRDTVSKNWEYWGARGVFTNHFMFEWGVATTIAPLRLEEAVPSKEEFARATKDGFEVVYFEMLHKIAAMKMYEEFSKNGWTRQLAHQTRSVLIPEIVKAVILGWSQAVWLAEHRS
jgi:hypothetical protein